MKENRLYLMNIQDCIRQIELYTAGGYDEFLRNRMIQDAVIRNLEIIGEATKRLSPEFRAENNEISWRQIAGLRIRLRSP